MAEQDVKDLIEQDPEFAKLKAETGPEAEDPQEELPGGAKEAKVEKFDADTVFEWWRTSAYATQPLTMQEVYTMYERSQDVHLARFEWEESRTFSISHLGMQGWLGQTARITGKDPFTLTFRSATVGEAQQIARKLYAFTRENLTDPPSENEYRMHQMVLNCSYSWVAWNNHDIVELAKDRLPEDELRSAAVELDSEPGKWMANHEIRQKFIMTLPQEFIDVVGLALGEFQRRSMQMLRGSLQGN